MQLKLSSVNLWLIIILKQECDKMTTFGNELNIDHNIGQKIFEFRKLRGMSRQWLAKQLGVSQQQCHKYESGANKVSASRLVSIANIFELPVNAFYENADRELYSGSMSYRGSCIDISRDLAKITNPEHRNIVKRLIKTLAKQDLMAEVA